MSSGKWHAIILNETPAQSLASFDINCIFRNMFRHGYPPTYFKHIYVEEDRTYMQETACSGRTVFH